MSRKIVKSCLKDNITGFGIAHYLTTIGAKFKEGDYSFIKSLERQDLLDL